MENQNHCLSIKQAKLFWQGVSFHSEGFLMRCVLSQWRFSDEVCPFTVKVFWWGVSFHSEGFLMRCVLLRWRFSDEVCPVAVKGFWWGVSFRSEGFLMRCVLLQWRFSDEVCPFAVKVFWWGVSFHSEGFLMRCVLLQWRFSDEVSFQIEGFLTRCVLSEWRFSDKVCTFAGDVQGRGGPGEPVREHHFRHVTASRHQLGYRNRLVDKHLLQLVLHDCALQQSAWRFVVTASLGCACMPGCCFVTTSQQVWLGYGSSDQLH